MKKRARTSVTNPFHDGHVFEYQPFNEARHPIPLELQQYGPTLIPQWNFLELLDYWYIHILFLVLLYSYDCTCIFHEVAAIAGEIIRNHTDKDIEPPNIVQRSIATSNQRRAMLRTNNPFIYCLMFFQDLRHQLPTEEFIISFITDIWNVEKNPKADLRIIDTKMTQYLTTIMLPCTRCSFPCLDTCKSCPNYISPLGVPIKNPCTHCKICNICHRKTLA